MKGHRKIKVGKIKKNKGNKTGKVICKMTIKNNTKINKKKRKFSFITKDNEGKTRTERVDKETQLVPRLKT